MTATVAEATETKAPPAPKRNSRGDLGAGTPGSRVRSAHRTAMSLIDDPKRRVSLRVWVRGVIKGNKAGPEWKVAVDQEDLKTWLDVKTHVRTPEKKKLMKEAKQRKRPKPKKPSKDRRRVKGNSGKR